MKLHRPVHAQSRTLSLQKMQKKQQLAFHSKNDQYPHRYSVHSKQGKPFQ